MTELEKTVDTEVGNDTEKSRLNFLKYVAYGKQLATEAMAATQPIYTQAQMEEALAKEKADADAIQGQMVEQAKSDTAKAVLDEVMGALGQSGDKQVKNEQDEIAAFEQIKAANPSDQCLNDIEALLKKAHQAAVDITVNDRDPALAAIRAKYVKA